MSTEPFLACAKLADEVIEAARLATDSYFRGENVTKRSVRMDMEALRSVLRSYETLSATIETQRINRNAGRKD